jgi:hypothetical protein
MTGSLQQLLEEGERTCRSPLVDSPFYVFLPTKRHGGVKTSPPVADTHAELGSVSINGLVQRGTDYMKTGQGFEGRPVLTPPVLVRPGGADWVLRWHHLPPVSQTKRERPQAT